MKKKYDIITITMVLLVFLFIALVTYDITTRIKEYGLKSMLEEVWYGQENNEAQKD